MSRLRLGRAGAGLGPQYRRLWTATAVSNLGDGMYLTALPLLAAQLTRDPLQLSLVAFAAWLPWLLFGLISGALVDRWDRRRTMWMVDVARFLVVGVLAAAVLAGWASIWLLIGVGFLLGLGATLFDNAAQSMIPAVVSHDSRQLERANGQLGAAMMVTQEMAGPAVGGAVFAVAASVPFAADAVSFGASSALIASIRGSFKPQRELPPGRRRRLRTEIGEGLRWLAGHRLLRTLAIMGGVANLVFMAGDAILVLFVQDKLGLDSAGFGLLLTAFALGGLPGSLLAARFSSRLPAGVVLIGGLLLWAVLYLVFGLASRPWVAAAVMVMMGVVFAFWEVVTVSLRQAIVPDRLIGRVVSAYRLLGYGAIPLGAVLGGVLGRSFGLRSPFVVGAVVLAAMALLAAPVVTTRSIQAARAAAESQRLAQSAGS